MLAPEAAAQRQSLSPGGPGLSLRPCAEPSREQAGELLPAQANRQDQRLNFGQQLPGHAADHPTHARQQQGVISGEREPLQQQLARAAAEQQKRSGDARQAAAPPQRRAGPQKPRSSATGGKENAAADAAVPQRSSRCRREAVRAADAKSACGLKSENTAASKHGPLGVGASPSRAAEGGASRGHRVADLQALGPAPGPYHAALVGKGSTKAAGSDQRHAGAPAAPAAQLGPVQVAVHHSMAAVQQELAAAASPAAGKADVAACATNASQELGSGKPVKLEAEPERQAPQALQSTQPGLSWEVPPEMPQAAEALLALKAECQQRAEGTAAAEAGCEDDDDFKFPTDHAGPRQQSKSGLGRQPPAGPQVQLGHPEYLGSAANVSGAASVLSLKAAGPVPACMKLPGGAALLCGHPVLTVQCALPQGDLVGAIVLTPRQGNGEHQRRVVIAFNAKAVGAVDTPVCIYTGLCRVPCHPAVLARHSPACSMHHRCRCRSLQ